MYKKKIKHHTWRALKPINTWLLLIVFVVASVLAVYGLRQNNLRSVELRDQLLIVDEEGGDVQAALDELREHIHSHMNAGLSSGASLQQPIQLPYTYERAVEAEQQRVQSSTEQLYEEAQSRCEARAGGNTTAVERAQCVEDYVLANLQEQRPIPDSLYKFDFAAPVWSADLAGMSLAVAALSLFLFVTRFGLERWVRSQRV